MANKEGFQEARLGGDSIEEGIKCVIFGYIYRTSRYCTSVRYLCRENMLYNFRDF